MTELLQPSWLEVDHLTHYRYGARVDIAYHMAHLCPRDEPTQVLEAFQLDIDPPAAHLHEERDRLGNMRTCFDVHVPHRELRVRSRSRVRVVDTPALRPDATLAWERVRERLRFAAGVPWEAASEFVFESPCVQSLAVVREFALPSFMPQRPIALAAIDLMQRIHEGFEYCPESTDVDTPLSQVLETREGVCQDFAHLMIGALRSMGLAARYVSGYLVTTPAEGAAPPRGACDAPEAGASAASSAPLLGADASHAWVSVWCPASDSSPARWLKLDPTNNLLPGRSHVRLAIGRDYSDVPPLRGVIRGGGRHRLEVQVRTRQVRTPQVP